MNCGRETCNVSECYEDRLHFGWGHRFSATLAAAHKGVSLADRKVIASEFAEHRAKARQLAMDYGMSPAMAASIYGSHTHEPEPTSKIPEYGAQFRARRALSRYAETFPGGGLKEAETLEEWYVRTAPKLTSPQARPFAALLREMTSIALATPVDELDALVEKAKHGRVGAPGGVPMPTFADPLGMNAPPTYPSPDPNYVPQHVQRAREAQAKADRYAITIYRSAPSTLPPLSLGEQRKADEAKKKAAGWKGSDALGYSEDYD